MQLLIEDCSQAAGLNANRWPEWANDRPLSGQSAPVKDYSNWWCQDGVLLSGMQNGCAVCLCLGCVVFHNCWRFGDGPTFRWRKYWHSLLVTLKGLGFAMHQ